VGEGKGKGWAEWYKGGAKGRKRGSLVEEACGFAGFCLFGLIPGNTFKIARQKRVDHFSGHASCDFGFRHAAVSDGVAA